MKIIYSIVWADSSSELSSEVNKQLGYGWKLQGGISACPTGEGTRLYQAMINDSFVQNSK